MRNRTVGGDGGGGGGQVLGHFVWQHKEGVPESLGDRLTPLGTDGSGSGNPQSGVEATAWNSGRCGALRSQGSIP